MTTAEYFSYAGTISMVMWLLMILLPKWRITKLLMTYKVVPVLLSISYVFFIVKSIGIGGGMDFGSLASVMDLFTEENAVMAGWIHYLAFDLLIGMWMIDLNKSIGIHSIFLGFCLVCTFMLGPIGFLLFLIFKTITKKLAI